MTQPTRRRRVRLPASRAGIESRPLFSAPSVWTRSRQPELTNTHVIKPIFKADTLTLPTVPQPVPEVALRGPVEPPHLGCLSRSPRLSPHGGGARHTAGGGGPDPSSPPRSVSQAPRRARSAPQLHTSADPSHFSEVKQPVCSSDPGVGGVGGWFLPRQDLLPASVQLGLGPVPGAGGVDGAGGKHPAGQAGGRDGLDL